MDKFSWFCCSVFRTYIYHLWTKCQTRIEFEELKLNKSEEKSNSEIINSEKVNKSETDEEVGKKSKNKKRKHYDYHGCIVTQAPDYQAVNYHNRHHGDKCRAKQGVVDLTGCRQNGVFF